jgi:hypothetical protein
MPYIGRTPTNSGQFALMDEISQSFDGSQTEFTCSVGATEQQPDAANVLITLGGVLQHANEAYTMSGSRIVFSEAPDADTKFYGIITGESQFIRTNSIENIHIADSAQISSSKLSYFTDINSPYASTASFGRLTLNDSGSSLDFVGDVSGSLISTGSFGSVNATHLNGILEGTLGPVANALISGSTVENAPNISGSITSTGSFGTVKIVGSGSSIEAIGDITSSLISTASFGNVVSTTVNSTNIGAFTLGGKLTAGSVEIEGSNFDIDGGTVDGITSLTAGGNLDIGSHGFRANTLTADNQTSGRVAIYGTNGLLSEDSDLTFSGATLTATNLSATTITATGDISTSGSIFAREFHTEFTSASVVFASGSNKFGDTLDDNHRFTGSIEATGSSLSITPEGGVSGSLTSTGSFGSIVTGGTGVSSFTGNVGIGTNNPNEKLHVEGSSPSIRIKASNEGGEPELKLQSDQGDDHDDLFSIRAVNEHALNIINFTGDTATSMMFISGSGKVGIGTNTFFSDGYSHLSIRGNASDGVSGLSFQVAGTNGSARNFSITANNSANGALDIRMSNANNNTPNTNRLLTLDINSKISLSNNDSGTNNTVFGNSAGANLGSGALYNTLFGHNAGNALTTGDANTFFGQGAGAQHTLGGSNIAIGHNAFAQTDEGTNSLSSADNIFIGQDAGGGAYANAESSRNIAIGNLTLDAALNGAFNNVVIGHQAASAVTSGDSNIVLGKSAALVMSTGNQNIIIGQDAGAALTTQDTCIFIGHDSGKAVNNNGANGSIFIGYQAGLAVTNGEKNTAMGYNALSSNQQGDKVVAIGYEAAEDYNPTADYGNSVFIGYAAGKETTTARKATIVGDLAVASGIMTGHENTVLGHAAGYVLTAGSGSTFVGLEAGASVTDGNTLIAMGYQAMKNGNVRYNASDSIAIGTKALYGLTTGNGNICIGAYSGYSISNGSYNTTLGHLAGQSFNASSTHNTLIGFMAGSTIGAAGDNNNTCIGSEAGLNVSTGVNNIVIGASSGRDSVSGNGLDSGDNNVLIGKFTRPSAANGDSEFVVGNDVEGQGNSKFTYGHGSSYVGLTAGSTTVFSSSDKRIKKNIKISEAGLSFINDLRPVTYEFKEKGELEPDFVYYEKDSTELVKGKKGKTYHGFIAQEVKEVIDKHDGIQNGFDGWNENKVNGEQHIGESAFIPMLVKAVQELSQKNEALEKRIEELEN